MRPTTLVHGRSLCARLARTARRAASLGRYRLLAGLALATLVAAAFVVGLAGFDAAATAAVAPECGTTNLSIASLNGPVYYTDSGAGMSSQFVGFTITNHESAITSLWATLGNFRGQSSTLIALNANEPAAHALGSLANGSAASAYWYTTDTSPATSTTTNAQYQDLTIYNGNPALGGTPICSYTNSFSSIDTPITAEANKVTNIISGSPVLGGTVTVEQQGSTGEIGSGPAADPGVFNMSPATSSSWPASAFELQSASVAFCTTGQPCVSGNPGTTTFTNILHLANMNLEGFGSGELYTAYFTYKVVGGTSSTTSVSPNVDIASGTQVKHTSGLPVGISPIAAATNTSEYLTISAGTPSLTYPGGTDAYTVTPQGNSGLVYESFSITMPSAATYVPGTSTWGGQTIANPTVSGQTLTYSGQFVTDGSSTLQFTLNYPASAGAGTFATTVTGAAGQTTIGQSVGSSTPASTTITVAKAPVVITPLNATIYQNASATYSYALSGLVAGDTTATLTTRSWTPPTCTSSYVQGSSGAGAYTISCSGASDTDYSFTYNTATLTVIASTGSSLSYDLNGGSGTTPSSSSGSLPYTVASNAAFSRSGYVFTGWNTASNGSGTAYQPGDLFTSSSATTLYAMWTAIVAPTVTVTFNANGGTGSMSAETFTSAVSQALATNAFTRTGFTFGGWSVVPGGTTATYTNGQSIAPTTDLDLYAIWTASVTVTYSDTVPSSANKCSDSGETTGAYTYPSGSATIAAPNLTGTGATTTGGYSCAVNGNSGHNDIFIGWNTSSTATNTTSSGWYEPGQVYAGSTSLTLYAIWTPYTASGDPYLYYSAQGGTGGPTNQDLGATSPATLSATVPTLAGYTFGGWCSVSVALNASCSGTTYAASGSYAFTTNTGSLYVVYAIWTATSYTLSYNANGGTGTTPSSASFSVTSAATVASASGLSETGATFVGWNTAANGSGTSYQPGDSFTGTASAVLYAQWAVNYAVTYSANGATSGSPPSAQLFTSGSVTVSGAGSLARSGYTFAGWNTAQDGSGTSYLAGSSYATSASVVLYAVWVLANTYEVTYLANGATGGSAPATQTFNGGSSVTIGTGSLTLAGYSFAGWNTAADDSGTAYAAGVTYSTAASLVLYAVWLPTSSYQVSYLANNATGGTAPASQSFTAGPVTISGNTGSLTRTGYTFAGWNTAADGSGTAYPANATYSTLANLALYAEWAQVGTYQVVYSPNGGTGAAPATQTFSTSSVTISANTFTRSGYQFIGWNTSPNGSGTTYQPADTYSASANLNLYAEWLATGSYAVTYDPNGASGSVAAQSFTLPGGSTAIASGSSLSLAGYVFSGWNTAANGSGTSYSAGANYSTAANLTLYAQFTAVPYTVTYDANGGSGTVASQSFNIAGGDSISAGSGFTNAGEVFVGWNTASDGSGTSYAPGDIYDAPINLYLFAQWIPSSSYAVVYDANRGGGSVATQVFTPPATATIASGGGFSYTGYTFTGWNTAANGSGTTYAVGATYSSSSNLTLYAQWSAVSYTVTYNTNGGTGTAPGTTTFTTASPATIAAGTGLSNAGYAFAGWNTATDGTGQTYGVGSQYGAPYDLVLYALWTPVGDTVIFNANGGTGSMSSESFTSGVAQTLTANAFTRSGYTFSGWNTADDGTGTSYTDGQTITISSGMTLYAQWTVNDTVTFSLNGGTGTTPTAETGEDGTTVTLPSGSGFSRAGYTFSGWNTLAGGGGSSYAAGATYTLAGSVTLYAQWTANATDTVTFSVNGGTGTTPTAESGLDGTTVTLPTGSGFSQAGYTFSGWNTLATGLGTSYGSGATYTLAGSVTLYAQWTANATDTVSFSVNGGTGTTPTAESGLDGTTVTLPTGSGLSRAGYTFAGWDTLAGGGGTSYAAGATYTLAGSVTLYAKWTANATDTVTFSVNGGTGTTPTAESGLDGTTVTLPTGSGFSQAGYTFAGWNTVAGGGGTSYAAGATYTLAGNATLYAQWTANATDTVTFDLNGGTGTTPTAESGLDGTTITLPSGTGALRVGYAFAGWNTAADGSGTSYAAGATYTLAGSATLYAQWTVNSTDTVTFSVNGGTGTTPTAETGEDGTTVTLPSGSGFSRAGYTFSGWNTLAGGGGSSYAAGATYTLAGSVTLYAQWTANATDTVTFSVNGGTGTTPTAESGLDGTTVTLPTGSGFSQAGYTFSGWNTLAGGGGTSYAAGATYTLAGSVTLYARWTVNSTDTVTFSVNGGTGTIPTAESGLDGTTVTLPSGSGFSRAGYTFAGWDTLAGGGGTSYAAGATYTLAGSVTLYAQWTANATDTVTFSVNGGTGTTPTAESGLDGTTVTLPTGSGFSRAGYAWAGWNTVANGSGTSYAAGETYTLAGNATLYAQWTLNATDTVTFSMNGGAGTAPQGASGADGTTVTLPSGGGFSLSGNTFSGWNTVANGSGTSYASGATYTLAGNATLYAQWTAANATDTVSFSVNGGTGAGPAAESGPDGTTLTLPTGSGFSQAGYTFGGWNTAADGSGASYASSAAYALAGSVTLYAQWTAKATDTVTFALNGGTGTTPTAESGLDGTTVTLPAGSGFSQAGYSFSGWNTAADGSGTSYGSGVTYTLTGSTTLYAQWTANATDTVTFSVNGGIGTAPTAETGLDGTTVTLPLGTGLSDAGDTFSGWNTAADGSGTHYASGATYTLTGSATLYAQWTANGTDTVWFSMNGGTGTTPPAESGLDGAGVTLAAGTGLSEAGYSFSGWNTAADGSGTQYPAGATYTLAGSLTMYAQWTANATDTVTYSANGGTGTTPAAESGLDGTTVTLAAETTFSRAGYTFTGWNTSSDGSGTSSAAGVSYTLAGSVTLYAQWTANATDTVTFSANGGVGTAPSPAHGLDGTTITLPVGAGLSRAGYTLSGWNTAPDETGTHYAIGASYTLAGSTTLYAQWTANATDTVTFAANGGSGTVPDAESGLGGTTVTLPSGSALSNAAATFASWNTAADGSGTSYAAGETYTLAGNATLYAQWTSNGDPSPPVTDPTPTPTPAPPVKQPSTVRITITFDAQGGSDVPQVTGDAGATIALPSDPTRAGYVFLGWFAAASGGDPLSSPYTLAHSTTLYAHWRASTQTSPTPPVVVQVTTTFDSTGGSPVAPVSGGIGTTITLPPAPTRTGYVFLGWFTAPSGGVALSSPYTLTRSATIYAHWRAVDPPAAAAAGAAARGGGKEVPPGAGEIITSTGHVTKVPIVSRGGEVRIGTKNYGLMIKTTGTSTTFAKSKITLVKGSNAVVGGYGFKRGTIVHIYLFSSGFLLGVARVQANGTYSGDYLVPSGLVDGQHTIRTVGTIFNGTSKTVAAPVTVISRERTIVIVPFAFNSSTLTKRLKAEVVGAARIIKEYRVRTLTLTGFTDPRGSIPYNRALSQRRTNAVQAYLIKELKAMRYPPKRLTLLGKGRTDFVFAGHGKVNDPASRRVVITLNPS